MIDQQDTRRLEKLRDYYLINGIMPTMRDMNQMFGFKSTNAAFKLCNRLISAGYLRKIGKRIAPTNEF